MGDKGVSSLVLGIPSLKHLPHGQEWILKHYELLGTGLRMKVILKDWKSHEQNWPQRILIWRILGKTSFQVEEGSSR